MELTISQMPANGFLGGPKSVSFTISHKSKNYKVAIEQMGIRTVTIGSPKSSSYSDTLEVYYTLESLLMLFDGHFYPVVSAFDGSSDITQSWKERTLPSYLSADFMLGSENTLIDYEEIIDTHLFSKWYSLKKELDLLHKMVLYCLSSVKMPKDMQCAFMTEAFIGVCELINKKCADFSLPIVHGQESKLKLYFLATARKYGLEIFETEFDIDSDTFAQILVNSRNRIAHIKSKQNRTYLSGAESVMYLSKLSLLYRVILFDLLEIPKELYQDKLKTRIQAINNHPVMEDFIKKLSGA